MLARDAREEVSMLRRPAVISPRALSRNAWLGMGELGPKELALPAGEAAQPDARRSAATTRVLLASVLLMRDMTISVCGFFRRIRAQRGRANSAPRLGSGADSVREDLRAPDRRMHDS